MNENSVEMRIFYPDGKPGVEGVIHKEGATATAIFFSKESCDDVCRVREKKQFSRQCVYVLWCPGVGAKPRAYIGISDNVRQRMYGHMRDKKFWTRAMVYTDGDRLRGDAEYIEARLVQIARQAQNAGLCVLDNTNNPRIRTYDDEAKYSAAEKHILNLCRFFLPLAGCDFLNPALASKTPKADQKPAKREDAAITIAGQGVELSLVRTIKGADVNARGRDTETGFVVAKNSTAVKEDSVSVQQTRYQFIADTRRDLVERKVLVKNDANTYRFSEDWNCKSAYKAASVILGRPTSGAGDWKDAKGRTLKQLQQR